MTPEDERKIRLIICEEVGLIIRKELRAALGVDKTDNEKLAMMPREDRQKIAKAQRAADRAARLAAK